MKLPPKLISNEVETDSYPEAMGIALNALAPRARSRAELCTHITKRGISLTTANAVLDSLELQGLVNDLDFAKAWIESRQRQKKLSKRAISGELRVKGVAQDIIDETIDEIDEDLEYQMAFELAERKFRSCSHLDSDVIYRRISAALARKGFGHGLTNRILRELLSA
jgi:regulatory protein